MRQQSRLDTSGVIPWPGWDLDAAKFGNQPDTSRQYSTLCCVRAYILHSTAWESNVGCGSAARSSLAIHGWLAHDVPRPKRKEKGKGEERKKGKSKSRLAKSNQKQISVLNRNAADIEAQG